MIRNKKVKVTKRIRAYKTKVKIYKGVEERKKWKKFGECANVGSGPEVGITSVGDEVFLDLVKGQKSTENKKKTRSFEYWYCL